MERNSALRTVSKALLLIIINMTFYMTTAAVDSSPITFPQPGKFYTLAGRVVGWEIIDGENVTTWHSKEIHKWSIQDVIGDIALVNRTLVDAYIRPQTGENYIDTYDLDYEIAIDRTILSAWWKTVSFATTGFLGSTEQSLDEDIGEHTWGWFPTDLYLGAYVLVSWTWDSRFLGDMPYEVVREEVIEVVGEKQNCWVLWMPPSITVDGTQGREEFYWVDKDTGVPLKLLGKGWALDESFGWEQEDVLANTNIDLGPVSTQPSSPTYTLNVPATIGFPEAGKFWSMYVFDEGWYMNGATNVTYYEEGLLTRWVTEVTDDEALVYKTFWGDYLCDAAGVDELESVDILYVVYRARISTREILEAVSATVHVVNMTSLTYEGPYDWTSQLTDDVGEETYCWLPTNLYIGAYVDITWSWDRSWRLYEATYTVVDEKTISALGEPQKSWVLYLPPTTSVDGTRNISETYYSDKDVGILLKSVSKDWALDGSSAWVENCWLMDTNVDLARAQNPLPYDLNYDGKVDIKDLAYAAKAFASWGPNGPDHRYPGLAAHPRWNPDADLNGDNKIDIRDLALIAINFGKRLP